LEAPSLNTYPGIKWNVFGSKETPNPKVPSQPLMLVGDSLAPNKCILVGHTMTQAPEQHHLPPPPYLMCETSHDEKNENKMNLVFNVEKRK